MLPRKEFTEWLVEQGRVEEVETMYDGWHADQWAEHGTDYVKWCEENGFEPENLDGV